MTEIVRDDLLGINILIGDFDENVMISGDDLQLIGGSLSRPLHLLQKICSQLADFKPIHKARFPVQ